MKTRDRISRKQTKIKEKLLGFSQIKTIKNESEK